MSLRYHFRGDDADQLRAMRVAAAKAIAAARRSTAPAGAGGDSVPPVGRSIAAALGAFPALALPSAPDVPDADRSEPATPGTGPDPARRLAAAWEGLDGDGTPWSYLCASLLRRELEDALGASRGEAPAPHAPPWAAQALVDAEPPSAAHWSWRGAPPSDWRLMVMEDTRRVLVRFLTTAPPPGAALLVHEDWYRRGEGYQARAGLQMLADWAASGGGVAAPWADGPC